MGEFDFGPQPEPVPDEFEHNLNSFTDEFGLSSGWSNSSTDEFEHNPNPFTGEFEYKPNPFRTSRNTKRSERTSRSKYQAGHARVSYGYG